MKLRKDSLQHNVSWKGYRLPQYDMETATTATHNAPTWLHFGAGNLFRAFPAVLAQRMLTAGLTDTGIICCEHYDEELIDKCYRHCDHLSVCVTLYSDGSIYKEVVASVTESLKMSQDLARLTQVFCAPSLQMVSFTITEKGYLSRDEKFNFLPDVQHDRDNGPLGCRSFFGKIACLCLHRLRSCGLPLALVSLDNCQRNGDRLHRAVMDVVEGWLAQGHITSDEFVYLTQQITYPLSMIDKITPHPDPRVMQALVQDGLEEVEPFVTQKNTYASIFVNSERPQYLIIEDAFPNGCPPLQQLGVLVTRRAIVEKSALMKVSTCMNPLDTALAIFGCLLGYRAISAEMADEDIVALVTRMAEEECLPMVKDPGVIDPVAFLHEVLAERYPNPYLIDTPQRVMTDTSQKLPFRYGVTLYAYYNSTSPMHRVSSLVYIPLVLAGWLRYLLGVDDAGNAMPLSPDPELANVRALLGNVSLGDTVTQEQLYPLLSSRLYFGANLFEVGVGETVVRMFNELLQGPQAVRQTIQRYLEQ